MDRGQAGMFNLQSGWRTVTQPVVVLVSIQAEHVVWFRNNLKT